MPRLPAVQRFLTSEGKRIYRIPFKWLPGVTGRVYLVLGAGPPTLVDTGCGRGVSTRNILDGIETVRREFGEPVGVGDLGRILLTHGHIDHSDGLGELLRQCGAEVGIHPADAPAVRWPVEYEERSRAALARFFQRAGVPDERTGALALPRRRADATLGTSVELALEDGLLLDGLRIIHTPGHSPGHVVIVADDVLLCGDHILPHTAPQQTPEHVTPGGGLRRYLESLDKVQQAGPFRVGLGGHEPVIDDVDHRIDVLRQWQLRRNDDLVDVLEEQARPSTIWEVCRVVYRQTEGVFLLFALLDTAARLEFLGEEGRVELKEDGVGSSWRFSSAGSPHPRPLSQRERGEACSHPRPVSQRERGEAMRRGLLLLGPTGAGKTPLGELLAERGCAGATCVHFDFGDQLRRIVAANRPDERIGSDEIAFLKSVLESGALLEREHLPLAIHILESFLETAAATEDAVVVLNGFPRHVEQAEALEGILQMSLIVHLSCSDEAVLQRMKSNVGGDRTDRVDDAPEAVRQRLATYARRTAPLVDHYARQGATLVTLEVTGQTTPEQVWTALDAQAANLAGW